MAPRLPWKRDQVPGSYIAYPTGDPAGGQARAWYGDHVGTKTWQAHVQVGGTAIHDVAETEAGAAARAAELWVAAVAREAEMVAAVAEAAELRRLVEDAVKAQAVDVPVFDLSGSPGERLLALAGLLKRRVGIPALAPLLAALSAELHARRLAGRPATDLGIYGTHRIATVLHG